MDTIFTYSLKKLIKGRSNEKAGSSDKEKISDLMLVRHAIKGSKEAFTSLIDSNKEYLYKTAFLYVKNQEDALEIYQETVYKAFINIHKLKSPEFFKTWITRILINNANDKLKAKDKHIAMDMLEEIAVDDSHGDISMEEKIDLYNAVDSLTSQYKTAIILKYFQNLTLKEIALAMECPENTVKSYLHRAKGQLLTKLEGREG